MVKVCLDTDICLDILLVREQFYHSSFTVVERSLTKKYQLCISEGCIPNLIYFTKEKYNIANGDMQLANWINSCSIISAPKNVILRAIKSNFKDKEDAYQYFTALHNDIDYLITRNKKDYAPYANAIPVYTPSEFLEIYDQ